jgi:putative transposase
MRRKRYSDETIVKALREVEAGAQAREVCRRIGVTEQTFYRWRQRFGNLQLDEAARLRQLEHENKQLKRIVADLLLDNQILKDANSKKW